MNLSTIVEKRKLYSDTLRNLEAKDIEAEVEKRLQDKKDEIRLVVKSEVEADKKKCENYIAILDELIDEETNRITTEPEPKAEDYNLPDGAVLLGTEIMCEAPSISDSTVANDVNNIGG